MTKLNYNADFLSAALSKYSAELHRSHKAVFKRRSRSRYLQLFELRVCRRNRTIDHNSQVGICNARDEGQARMCKSPCEGYVAVSAIGVRTASVTPTVPLHQTRRDRSSAAPAMGRRFCVSGDNSCLKNPSRKPILFKHETSRGVKFSVRGNSRS